MELPDARPHLAFLCAMPMELKPLARRMRLRPSEPEGPSLHVGSLGERPVVATVTGMGTANARRGTHRLLDARSVEHVVVVGITGALDDVTPIGTLVHPELVVDAATGTEHRPAPLADETPRGKMWTTDGLTTDPAELAGLRARGVVSLDMETAAVADVCEARGVRWSVVRAISDRASDGRVDEEVFGLSHLDGTPNPRAVLRYLVRHPGNVPRLVGLARGARRATERAAAAAIAACSHA